MNKEYLKSIWKQEEDTAHIHGWDFSHIHGRYEEENDLPWDYEKIVRQYLKRELNIMDYDTGGGEFLLSLNHPYSRTAATEGYPPNVELCSGKLLPLGIKNLWRSIMKKWYDEEYEFEIEVTGFLKGDHTERYCRNGEEIGDKYTCTYGCPVNKDGYGICSKAMMMLYPLMEAVRSGGDLENLGGDGKYSKTIVCPDGCVMFRLTAKPLGNENFHKGGFWKEP